MRLNFFKKLNSLIKLSICTIIIMSFSPLVFAEYYVVYPGPSPCFTCRHVYHHPCRKRHHVYHRVHRVHPCYRCGSVRVYYTVPVAPAPTCNNCDGYYVNQWTSVYRPSCLSDYCYNPDMSTGDDQVMSFPDLTNQY